MTEIDWPAGWERTAADERKRTSRFDKSLRQSVDELAVELERVGVDDWRLSTGARHQKRNPRYPYANANPDDPGAVVQWSMNGEQYAVACDTYTDLRDNVRTLYYYVREKRKMESRSVRTGENEFSNLRLPSGEEATGTLAGEPTPCELLGVSPDADADEVESAFRERVKTAHPDGGGSGDEYRRLQEAREAMTGGAGRSLGCRS